MAVSSGTTLAQAVLVTSERYKDPRLRLPEHQPLSLFHVLPQAYTVRYCGLPPHLSSIASYVALPLAVKVTLIWTHIPVAYPGRWTTPVGLFLFLTSITIITLINSAYSVRSLLLFPAV